MSSTFLALHAMALLLFVSPHMLSGPGLLSIEEVGRRVGALTQPACLESTYTVICWCLL